MLSDHFLALLYIQLIIPFRLCSSCLQSERDALIRLKDGLDDPSNRLASWSASQTDCCSWPGVGCNNKTGNVIRLDLRNPHPSDDPAVTSSSALSTDQLNPYILALSHLTHLDLSGNYFWSAPIPDFIGSFKELTYLNLSRSGFAGVVTSQLGNLTALASLDLSSDISTYGSSSTALYVADTAWLARLKSLEILDMSYVSFERAPDWLHSLNMLPYLLEVRLSSCSFPPGSIQVNLQFDFTSLAFLDLSGNSIGGPIPGWVFEQSSLEYLDLSNTQIHGAIPASIGNLTSLKVLDLSGGQNNFSGGIPETMGKLCNLRKLQFSKSIIDTSVTLIREAFSGCIKDSLEELNLGKTGLAGYFPDWLWDFKNLKRLDLSWNSLHGSILIPAQTNKQSSLQELNLAINKLNGTLMGGLGELVELVHLDLSYNSLKGVLTESNFTNLVKLQHLDLTQNSLQLALRSDWIPPFQLHKIALSSCQVGPQFPKWLRTQQSFYHLDLSSTRIADNLPDWFWNSTSHTQHVDLSHNEISGKLPLSFRLNVTMPLYIDLGSNRFRGPLPPFPSNAIVINLSDNLLSGPIPASPSNGEVITHLSYLSLSTNSITGSIPSYLCKSEVLEVLDLSHNYLSGEIPDCWNNINLILQYLDLSHNNLSGRIPDAIGSLSQLESLNLRNNILSQELTYSLKNCTQMISLDLGYNKLTGNIPTWVGESLPRLTILVLRSNIFVGTTPPQLPNMKYLKVLDLANNKLSGTIPRSFGNFTAMTAAPKLGREGYSNYYKESASLIIKGRQLEFKVLLASLPITMDLSENSLTGTIPEDIVTNLLGLQSLNLSGNYLTGEITTMIGGMRRLESLDLSRNQFSGVIPSTLSGLNFLTHLNLSYNNFFGGIPIGNQLQTLDDQTIYIGNPHLCGYPLNRKCPSDEEPKVPETVSTDDENNNDGDDTEWFYAGIGLGFASGIWLVCGILVFKERPRNACFSLPYSVPDGICNAGHKYPNVGRKWPMVVGWVIFFSVFVCLAGLWNWVWR